MVSTVFSSLVLLRGLYLDNLPAVITSIEVDEMAKIKKDRINDSTISIWEL